MNEKENIGVYYNLRKFLLMCSKAIMVIVVVTILIFLIILN